MKIKELPSAALISLIGILVVEEVYSLIQTIFLIAFLTITESTASYPILTISNLFSIIAIIFGLYVGIKSYSSKNLFYNIFYPRKQSLLVSLIISVLLVVIILFFGNKYLAIGDVFISIENLKFLSSEYAIPLTLNYFITFYPFSSLLYFVYKNRKLKILRNSKLMIIGLLIILNPIFITISTSMNTLIGYWLTYEACGVSYSGFAENSPAKDAGMSLSEVIIEVDTVKIKTTDDLGKYLDGNQFGKNISIKTNESSYNTKLRLNETSGRYMLGITGARNEICKR